MTSVMARGGTELLYSYLYNALPSLCDKVQIILSRPEQVELLDKPRVLWIHDLPQDPAIQRLQDPSYRSKFNAIVFVSHWQQQMFAMHLQVPFKDGIVIKNGVPRRPMRRAPRAAGEKLKFIYTSTPHRGLGILAGAAAALAKVRQDWELHVYSSMNIYGRGEEDKQFEPLYNALRENPCVVYHGTVANAVVRDAVEQSHVMVYPSIYPETSCMALQEALMAGCLCITSNYGALPETCAEWAWMFQYDERPEILAQRTYLNMAHAIENFDNEKIQSTLQVQSTYYQNFYAFEARVPLWQDLLTRVAEQGAPVEKMVFA